ncbi:DNA-3-methyladenine glycosylase 2 family protein [Brevibacillus composti]|uniref:DNA-3-methyladenine glycosylase II n=1 Tax=Brevibacillus composti TaxID=2796470 RepID=A0A7T5EJ06_9BACL|nr:DNA-3-methyladenine glycosylase 2 family protein [Brevibacillus composti]QQE73496.1 DNA-3-methyladenine glycosylase 2 family protein [Brevibacillus composti]QUO40578.1 DNA-3-methyladenine glycosylase 2 family protein [Brevibacillus composti]
MPKVRTKSYDYGQTEIDSLTAADPVMGEALTRLGRLERVVIPDLFAALIHAMVGQLISAKAAQTIWERLQDRCGEMTAQRLAGLSADEIQRCGMTMKKAVSIHNIARLVAQGDVHLDELRDMSDQEVIAKLTALPGVGRWTAEMLLIHSLERPDVVSWGDIAIRRGMMKPYGLETLTKEQFDRFRQRYSPHGTVASIYLWEISFE